MALNTTVTTDESLKTIRTSLNQWDQMRKVAPFQITNAYGFRINLSDFQYWTSKNLQNFNLIHCYLGVNPLGEMEFYLIDSPTDYKPLENADALIHKRCITNKLELYLQEDGTTVKPPENAVLDHSKAERRIANWMLWSNVWLQETLMNCNEIPQIISIPYEDIMAMFGNGNDVKHVNAIFALKNFRPQDYSKKDTVKKEQYSIEVILSRPIGISEKHSGVLHDSYADVSKPRPPFGIDHSKFNLLFQNNG